MMSHADRQSPGAMDGGGIGNAEACARYARMLSGLGSDLNRSEFSRLLAQLSYVCIPGVYERYDSTPECPKFVFMLGVVPTLEQAQPVAFLVLDMSTGSISDPELLPAFGERGFLSLACDAVGEQPTWRYTLKRAFNFFPQAIVLDATAPSATCRNPKGEGSTARGVH